MSENTLYNLIAIGVLVIFAIVYYTGRSKKRNTYKGSTVGYISSIESNLWGRKATFVYHVGGKKYTGTTSLAGARDRRDRSELGKEIPVQYDEEHPEEYLVPDPFRC